MANKYIMHENIPVIKMSEENGICSFTILNEQLAPFIFLNSRHISSVEWQQFLSNRLPIFTDKNASKINDFLTKESAISIQHIKQLEQSLNVKNNKDLILTYIQNRTSLLFYGVSVTDSYWTKDENDKITWEDINPRTHELKDICKDKELSQKLECQNEISYHNLGIGNGATPKIWRHDGSNNVNLYKQGGEIETQSEILVSNVLDYTNIPHVKYEIVSERCCECENIANENYSIVSSSDLLSYLNKWNININTFCKTLNPDLYYATQVIDFLIDNPDRTIYNQGFLRDNETGNIVDMLPLFDHNNAFSGRLKETKDNNIEEYATIVAKAQYALSKCNIKFSDKINTFVFENTDKYLEFMNRAYDIGLFTKRQNKGLISNLFNKTPSYILNEKYKLTYKDEQILKSPDIEFNVETKTFVKSKTKQIKELTIEIESTIKKVIQNNHTVKKNFMENNIIEYDIDHKKYEYIQDIQSMKLFLKEVEKEYIKEKSIEKEKNNFEIDEIDILEK